MKIFALALLLTIGSAHAVDQRITTYRISTTVVISPGDPVTKAQNAKRPTVVYDVVNAFGAKIAERWEYHQGRKITALIVQGGRITTMYEVRD